jgi:hypothetical protein
MMTRLISAGLTAFAVAELLLGSCGPGTLIVAMNDTLTHVVIQFTDPEWWIHLTPDEARNVARLLNGKADELEADQRAAGSN